MSVPLNFPTSFPLPKLCRKHETDLVLWNCIGLISEEIRYLNIAQSHFRKIRLLKYTVV